jgi:hypothetical protein
MGSDWGFDQRSSISSAYNTTVNFRRPTRPSSGRTQAESIGPFSTSHLFTSYPWPGTGQHIPRCNYCPRYSWYGLRVGLLQRWLQFLHQDMYVWGAKSFCVIHDQSLHKALRLTRTSSYYSSQPSRGLKSTLSGTILSPPCRTLTVKNYPRQQFQRHSAVLIWATLFSLPHALYHQFSLRL